MAREQSFFDTREVLRRDGSDLVCLWGGMGSGARCQDCGQVIATDDIEYELTYLQQHGEIVTLKLHRECWERSAEQPASG